MTDINAHFEKIFNQYGPKHWAVGAKKDSVFVSLVEDRTCDLTDCSFSERVLVALGKSIICPRGNRKKYKSITQDFGFCGTTGKCQCASEQVSRKCRENIDHEARLAKTSATLLSRYGSTNPGQTPSARVAHRNFYNDPEKVKTAVEKARLARRPKNTINRVQKKPVHIDYPDAPAPMGMIKCMICHKPAKQISPQHCKIHDLTLREYMDQFPNSPIMSEEMLKRRSVAAFGRVISDDHKGLISASKLGKARNGSNNISKIKEFTYAILNDTEKLTELVDKNPIKIVAEMLGVGETFLAKKCDEMGIRRFSSSIEQTVAEMLLAIDSIYVIQRTKKIIPPLEIDIYISSHNLAIEVCGLYYHSDEKKPDSYHENKMNKCHDKGIRLLTIFEDEVYEKRDVIKSRILHMLGLSTKGIGARKLTVSKIDMKTANDFYNLYHMQNGSKNNSISYGAFHNDVLVAAMSFKKSWRASGTFELSRFSTNGKAYSGIASKLFKSFVREYNPEHVVTYADRRWSEGDVYINMGFELTKKVQRSYYYWKRSSLKRIDKTKMRLNRIRKLVENGDEKTERQITKELNYLRIYDCGKLRFDWKPQ